MARVLAVLALHAGALEEELAAQRAEDYGVKLLLDELVPVLLVDLLLALAHGALSTESAGVVRAFPDVRLDCARASATSHLRSATRENVPKLR